MNDNDGSEPEEASTPQDRWHRDSGGRFGPGNPGGCGGGVLAAKMSALRSKLLASVSEQDIADIIEALVAKAISGDVPAAREVIDRCCGRAEAIDLAIRLEAIEEALAQVDAA